MRNWRALLRNKKVLAGAGIGAAALVGGIVWYRRQSAGGSAAAGSSATPSAATVTGSTTGTGYPDTTGTDIAEWLGTQEQNLSTQQQQFLDQLTTTLQGAGTIPTSGGTGTTTTMPIITPVRITVPPKQVPTGPAPTQPHAPIII